MAPKCPLVTDANRVKLAGCGELAMSHLDVPPTRDAMKAYVFDDAAMRPPIGGDVYYEKFGHIDCSLSSASILAEEIFDIRCRPEGFEMATVDDAPSKTEEVTVITL